MFPAEFFDSYAKNVAGPVAGEVDNLIDYLNGYIRAVVAESGPFKISEMQPHSCPHCRALVAKALLSYMLEVRVELFAQMKEENQRIFFESEWADVLYGKEQEEIEQ